MYCSTYKYIGIAIGVLECVLEEIVSILEACRLSLGGKRGCRAVMFSFVIQGF